MGNVESVHEKSEDQENGVNTDNYEILSEQVCVQNGPATLQNAQPVSFQKSDLVDARTSNQQNNVSISTQKAMEISSISDESGTDLGTEAKPDAPPARSRFRMSLSRPVSGRTATQATNATDASLKLDISSQNPPVNNAPSEKIPLPEVVEVNESSNKTQVQVPNSVTLSEIEVSTAPPSEAEITQPKPKEISLFDKLFKPEKAKEKSKSPGEDSQEILTVAEQDPVIVVNASSGLQSNAPPAQDVADCNQNTVTLSSPASVSFAEDFQDPEESQGSTKPATPPVEHPVMSFFKTLVSPNKTPSKPEEEQKKEPEENKKENGACKKPTKIGFTKKSSKLEKTKGGQPASPQKTEPEATESMRKTQESPKTKKGTLSRLFRHKSTKETHQSTAANLAQEPVAVSVTVKSEKASPAQITKQDTKSSESAGNQQQQQQVTKTPEIQKDDAKEKAAKESTPRTRLFWKKNAAEPEMEAVKVEVSVQASAPSKDDTKSQEADDKARKSKGEESKPPKPKLMTFFKQLSVIGDGGNTNSVEINEKDPSQPTLDSTDGAAAKPPEKAVAPAAVEAQPAAQKIKDASKEKKAAVEQSKQKANKPETKDSQDALSSAPQQAPESSVLQNGGGSPRNSPKRLEKRQSFGAFFKGIGPKRTCDAESQTDPVSILPAEKAK
ncbi:breast carcinoma-amplified sequence 1 isoform X2 [Ambystoma mexicanum]|uniref:breast carcinoma-amplified sequence 1 isoform X2 n=1 Tax=Ambystoma mexicanum TaxID=8296 RepID=UPI0037E96F17